MKIRISLLLLALAMNVMTYANAAPAGNFAAEEVSLEQTTYSLETKGDFHESLNSFINDLDEDAECSVTVKFKLGTSGTGIEASFTVTGDCDEIMEIAEAKYDEVKRLLYR
ncbi:hypothetical protein [Flavilitoribacter nigricans]|uniref:Uncharacterized protein n=1 Tax=Flavilitoribacter nigricans (strain ATCC 23147 / DSM 23189 / NBRC 102662 / NCIMB 1420 / SS-2) TaxID=1122177 RepID=A0A2D0N8G6_FLAN2|nr:hypothetical protein [Flavilitoribacter nigricans]PHN04777.1 hypothetical protein CRP01_19900 [Flavilitoribacter nigricans DSM 23189 = NBRC 102662]